MRPLRILALGAVLTCLGTALHAHDFWIEASSFKPAAGERGSLDLKVGQHVEGDSVARNEARIVGFVARGPDALETAILGVDGRAPAGYWRPSGPGLYLIGYRSSAVPIELAAAKFEAYLAEEGLQPVIDARKASGDTGKLGREIYSRSAKSMVLCGGIPKAGAASLKGFDERLGLRLEIVPETNPYVLEAGDKLSVRVWFDNKPLAGALVGFTAKSAPDDDVRLRTDAEGRVTFVVAHDGMHLVRTCWMVPAPQGTEADWESTWGSLTLEIKVAAPAPAAPPAPTPAPGK